MPTSHFSKLSSWSDWSLCWANFGPQALCFAPLSLTFTRFASIRASSAKCLFLFIDFKLDNTYSLQGLNQISFCNIQNDIF